MSAKIAPRKTRDVSLAKPHSPHQLVHTMVEVRFPGCRLLVGLLLAPLIQARVTHRRRRYPFPTTQVSPLPALPLELLLLCGVEPAQAATYGWILTLFCGFTYYIHTVHY